VEEWEAVVGSLPFDARLKLLTGIYQDGDPFCHLEHDEDGTTQLVETNCPYLEVARRRPALCSVTVSVLRRLLGRKVVRTQRLQDGHGRCVFKIFDQPADTNQFFEREPEPSA
jgi:predicted ArsR family transcriptional regulator